MILAAGRGERMRPLTDTRPKPMLVAGGKPLLQWHVEALVRAGFERIVINHAYLGEQIEAFFGNGEQFGAQIQYSAETQALETAGGIRQALHALGQTPFLVINGDVYSDWPLSHAKAVLQHWKSQQLAHLVLVPNPAHNQEGDFSLDTHGIVHTDKELHGPALTFSGIGIYHPQLFSDIALGQPNKLAPLLRIEMQNSRVSGEMFEGLWMDIGTPARLKELDTLLSHNGHTTSQE